MERADSPGLTRTEALGGLLWLPLWVLGGGPLAAWLVRVLGGGLSDPDRVLAASLIRAGLNLAVLVPLLRRFLAGQLRRLRARGRRCLGDLAGGLGLYFALLFALVFALSLVLPPLLRLLPDYQNPNEAAVEALLAARPLGGLVLVLVVAPLSEELLCRGVVFCGLLSRSRVWAYALSMGLFAGLHVAASLGRLAPAVVGVSFLLYLPGGWVLARRVETSGSFWTAVGLHSLINLTTLGLHAVIQ